MEDDEEVYFKVSIMVARINFISNLYVSRTIL